jgi:HSP20 family molecular chaperone IbpA
MQCPELEERIEKTIQRVLQKQSEDHVLKSFINKENQYELSHFVGSVRPEHIQVTEQNGIVTIQGHETVQQEDGSSCMYAFARHVPLPQGAAIHKLESHLKNGYVTLILPK